MYSEEGMPENWLWWESSRRSSDVTKSETRAAAHVCMCVCIIIVQIISISPAPSSIILISIAGLPTMQTHTLVITPRPLLLFSYFDTWTMNLSSNGPLFHVTPRKDKKILIISGHSGKKSCRRGDCVYYIPVQIVSESCSISNWMVISNLI